MVSTEVPVFIVSFDSRDCSHEALAKQTPSSFRSLRFMNTSFDTNNCLINGSGGAMVKGCSSCGALVTLLFYIKLLERRNHLVINRI